MDMQTEGFIELRACREPSLNEIMRRLNLNGDPIMVSDDSGDHLFVGQILECSDGTMARIVRFVSDSEFRAWRLRNIPERANVGTDGFVHYEIHVD
jgi:hypothetical protein